MNQKIGLEVNAYKKLQKLYQDYGARDREAEFAFQIIIRQAVENRPVEFDRLGAFDFALSGRFLNIPRKPADEKAEAVAKILIAQAKKVYDVIRKEQRPQDLEDLKQIAYMAYGMKREI